jgi:hypothetical protein
MGVWGWVPHQGLVIHSFGCIQKQVLDQYFNLTYYSCSYAACIRRAAGYCCVEYQVCQGVTSAFSLDGSTPANGRVDTYCTGDYIAIPGKLFLCYTYS